MREVKREIEEQLGYSFRLEELPPGLRARLRKLAEKKVMLEEIRWVYESKGREIARKESEERERINALYSREKEQYSKEIASLNKSLSELKKEKRNIIKYVIYLAIAFVVFPLLFL